MWPLHAPKPHSFHQQIGLITRCCLVCQGGAMKPRNGGSDEVSAAGADFGSIVAGVGQGMASTFAVAATLNLSVVSKNAVVFITMGTSWWWWWW
jgi:hypothetical protein